jgi:hypothetical protein
VRYSGGTVCAGGREEGGEWRGEGVEVVAYFVDC